MNPVLRFIQSDLYKNFWKFTLVGALTSGALVALSHLISLLYEKPYYDFVIVFYIAFIGMAFGYVAAFLGFFVMYFLGRIRNVKVFSYLSVIVGLCLATLVVVVFSGSWSIPLSWKTLVFPGIPYFGSVYFFRKFALKYIYPLRKDRSL